MPNEGGAGDDVLHLVPTSPTEPYFTTYVASIDAHCFQACVYEPYEP
ncbi:MAG: hypothetical protein P1P87_04640 [Trueperaceae bacterium]|nr:hypothetical protein [Trueperaceae bacterium]